MPGLSIGRWVMLVYSEKVEVSAGEKRAYLAFALDAAERAGAATLPFFRSGARVDNKGDGGEHNRGYDPVTEADRAAETAIRERLRQSWPEHGVFAEEFGHTPGNGLTWVIDPIDGTRGFITGMLHWGVLLALFDGQAPVLGVMHQPFSGEFFHGDGERAGYRRGPIERALRVRPCAALEDAALACTTTRIFAPGKESAAFMRVDEQVRLTRFGGDCYNYALLAMGCLDLVVEASLKPYDIQALIPIVRGAGGVITTWSGGDPSMGGAVVAAGDVRVHQAALRVLNR